MLQNGKDKGKAIKVLAWGQDVRKNERKAKKQDIETLEILKKARGRNVKQVLKYSKNAE